FSTICRISEEAFKRPGPLRYTVEDIPMEMCTHLVFGGFLWTTKTGELAINYPGDHITSQCVVNDLRKKFPHLKTILEYGQLYNGASFARLIGSEAIRERFVKSALERLRRHHFDGFNVFWDAYDSADVTPDAKSNLILLLKRTLPTLNLSLAGASINTEETLLHFTDFKHFIRAHIIPATSRLVDHFQVFTALLRRSVPGRTAIHSQLFPSSRDEGRRQLNIDSIIRMCEEAGIPKHKTAVTLSFAGRLFMLLDIHKTEVSDPTNSKYDNETVATLPFFQVHYKPIILTQICRNQLLNGWSKEWDGATTSPYTFSNLSWVSYDDRRSLQAKVDWAILQNLAGVFVWSVDQDDYRANCHDHPYPLMTAIYNVTKGIKPRPVVPERECKECKQWDVLDCKGHNCSYHFYETECSR
ncbi:unnamed protein product, partial [Ixodes hexagonus]